MSAVELKENLDSFNEQPLRSPAHSPAQLAATFESCQSSPHYAQQSATRSQPSQDSADSAASPSNSPVALNKKSYKLSRKLVRPLEAESASPVSTRRLAIIGDVEFDESEGNDELPALNDIKREAPVPSEISTSQDDLSMENSVPKAGAEVEQVSPAKKPKKLTVKDKLEIEKENERLLRTDYIALEPQIIRRDLSEFARSSLNKVRQDRVAAATAEAVKKPKFDMRAASIALKRGDSQNDDADSDIELVCSEDENMDTAPKPAAPVTLQSLLSSNPPPSSTAKQSARTKVAPRALDWKMETCQKMRIAEALKRQAVRKVEPEVATAPEPDVAMEVEKPNEENVDDSDPDWESDEAEISDGEASSDSSESSDSSGDSSDDEVAGSETVVDDEDAAPVMVNLNNQRKTAVLSDDEEENEVAAKIANAFEENCVDIAMTAAPAKQETGKSRMFAMFQNMKDSAIVDASSLESIPPASFPDTCETSAGFSLDINVGQMGIEATQEPMDDGEVEFKSLHFRYDQVAQLVDEQEDAESKSAETAPETRKLRRLQRPEDMSEHESEDDSDDEKITAPTDPVLKPQIKTNFVEDEADVEDDEFLNNGGADGDIFELDEATRAELAAFIDEDQEVIAKMTLADLKERAKQDEFVRAFFNQQMRDKDLKDTKNLVKDIATGKILDRRKHGANISRTELDKFGRAEEDEDVPALRELDEAEDYGVFGDIISKYVSIRKEASRANMLKKRKRGEAESATAGDAGAFVGHLNEGQDEINDWTNETAAGGVQIGPGEFIETDLDKLEEKMRRKSAISRMNVRQDTKAPVTAPTSSKILYAKETSPRTRRRWFTAADASVPTAEDMKNLPAPALSRIKSVLGVSDSEWKSLQLGNVNKLNKSGFQTEPLMKKTATFAVLAKKEEVAVERKSAAAAVVKPFALAPIKPSDKKAPSLLSKLKQK